MNHVSKSLLRTKKPEIEHRSTWLRRKGPLQRWLPNVAVGGVGKSFAAERQHRAIPFGCCSSTLHADSWFADAGAGRGDQTHVGNAGQRHGRRAHLGGSDGLESEWPPGAELQRQRDPDQHHRCQRQRHDPEHCVSFRDGLGPGDVRQVRCDREPDGDGHLDSAVDRDRHVERRCRASGDQPYVENAGQRDGRRARLGDSDGPGSEWPRGAEIYRQRDPDQHHRSQRQRHDPKHCV